jgi:hypothetical protein
MAENKGTNLEQQEEEDVEIRVEGEDDQQPSERDHEETPKDDGEDDSPSPTQDKKTAKGGDDEDDESDLSEEEIAKLREKRRKEKEERKARRERAIARDKLEMEFLRKRNEDLEKRIMAQEMRAHRQDHYTVEQRIAEAEREARLAEEVLAKAVAEANGDDVTKALRFRDEALNKIRELSGERERLKYEEDNQKTQKTVADPVVNSYAKEWIRKNSWYDVNGGDEDSRIVLEIDQRLANEGYVPRTEAYWKELDKRVRANLPHRYANDETFDDDEDDSDDYVATTGKRSRESGRQTERERENSAANRGAKKGPPIGQSREHAPNSTRKEIYITKERKEALIQAGVWDDPVLRQRYIKQYQSWDRDNAVR